MNMLEVNVLCRVMQAALLLLCAVIDVSSHSYSLFSVETIYVFLVLCATLSDDIMNFQSIIAMIKYSLAYLI